MSMQLLLLSNSTNHGGTYLGYCEDEIREFLRGVSTLLFIPYALHDRDGYARVARERFAQLSIQLESIHQQRDAQEAVAQAEAVFIGGGNTFRLLKTLQSKDLIQRLRERVRGGMPYMGASAGTNMACPTLKTTNDMPIVEPESFNALRLVPFQINPHYLDPDPDSTHMGETREARIQEFLEENDLPVLGLREGCWLRRDGSRLHLGGGRPLRLFRPAQDPEEIAPGERLDELLT